MRSDTACRVRGIRMNSGASPEGSTALNKALAKRRATNAERYIDFRLCGSGISMTTHAPGIDWERLILLTEADLRVPFRAEALDILRNTPEHLTVKGVVTDERKHRLMLLGGGSTWKYMYEHLFPELRSSILQLWYEYLPAVCPDTMAVMQPETEMPADTVCPHLADTMSLHPADTVCPRPMDGPMDGMMPSMPMSCGRKPLYMAVKTNLLYDALVVPNIGLEFYLGHHWSVSANWMYTWLKSDKRHRYHRIYGGELEVRRWLSRGKKPLTGHHIGLYGQMLTYDLEWGGKGYLADRWSYGGGFSYGYSAPIGRRLNLDFTLGIGYLGGEYREYVPREDLYVWRATKNRRWFGPTKAEITLVWLLGHGNYNGKKGGEQ